MNDLLHGSSTSGSALMARNTDRAVKSKKRCALSVDGQVEVARRGSGDAGVDGQVGPLGEFDDVRRTEEERIVTRSYRSCHHQEVNPC